MTGIDMDVDRLRERWRRARAPLHMVDTIDDDFASGGLASEVEELSVRLLILPSDPDGVIVPDLTDALWAWWKERGADPVTGQRALWGEREVPSIEGAALVRRGYDAGWGRYLTLLRNGGIDMALGEEGVWRRAEARVFRLITIVGRVWAALETYRGVADRLDVVGPWEVSLALTKTSGAYLGTLGQGWQEPLTGPFARNEDPRCSRKNLLIRREVQTWPDEYSTSDLAFSIGGWIEDAWGKQLRRFFARTGPLTGKFDSSQFDWS